MNGPYDLGDRRTQPRLSRRARTRIAWIALSLCAVTVVSAVAWVKLAASARAEVSIDQAAPVTCVGGTVTHRRVVLGRAAMDVVGAQEGMHCTLTVRFTNEGRFSVHLDTATFPFMGPETGGLLRLTGPLLPYSEDNSSGRDAEVQVDEDLAGGDSMTAAYHFVFNGGGCVDGTMWVGSLPTVSDEAMGLSGSVDGHVTLAFIGHGDTSGCPRR